MGAIVVICYGRAGSRTDPTGVPASAAAVAAKAPTPDPSRSKESTEVILRIQDNVISSDASEHYAVYDADAAADGSGAWVASWLPGRLLTRNQAISGLLAQGYRDQGQGDHPAVTAWESEAG